MKIMELICDPWYRGRDDGAVEGHAQDGDQEGKDRHTHPEGGWIQHFMRRLQPGMSAALTVIDTLSFRRGAARRVSFLDAGLRFFLRHGEYGFVELT